MIEHENETNESTSEPADRDRVLELLSEQLEFTETRIQTLAGEENPDEQLLVRWVRTVGYLSGRYRKLSAEQELDEMKDDLQLLKSVANIGDDE